MIICGTGHRPTKLGGYDNSILLSLAKMAKDAISGIGNVEKIISGMALGWDQALALAAIDMQIPLVAAVPFKGQENAWPPASQEVFRDYLRNAHTVHIVCEGGYAAWKMQKRNEWMVDNANIVLALWNGTPGGTMNCLEYANHVGKEVVNLWEDWRNKYSKGD